MVLLRSGKLIGRLFKAEEALKRMDQASEEELDQFTTQANQLSALVTLLNVRPSTSEVDDVRLHVTENCLPQDQEESNWGPKISDPGPDQIYPSCKLRETIDVDPKLETSQ